MGDLVWGSSGLGLNLKTAMGTWVSWDVYRIAAASQRSKEEAIEREVSAGEGAEMRARRLRQPLLIAKSQGRSRGQ